MAAKSRPFEITVRDDPRTGRRRYGFRIVVGKAEANRPPFTDVAAEARKAAEKVAYRRHRS